MISNPYISIVIPARNDDYGFGFLHRLQVFLDTFLTLCENHNLDTELIIVEWNPPPETPRLREVLTWPKNLKLQKVRIIEVPGAIHNKLPYSGNMTMFEYIAKNVGIRRARGEYVLAMNNDDIPDRGLTEFLSLKELSPECFYRIDARDIEGVIPLDKSVEERLDLCARHWSRVHTVKGVRRRSLPLLDYHYLWSVIKWLGGRLLRHPRSGVHTNKSGDFFLMHRNHWHSLHGYPQLSSNSYIDGLMCFMAASSGLSQVILDDNKRLYHQEHSRSHRHNRPTMNFRFYLEQGKRMMKSGQPLIANDEGWGLKEEELAEVNISFE